MVFAIGLRNIRSYWRRYVLVTLTLSIGFAILVAIMGSIGGFSQALSQKATRYFPGLIGITEFDHQQRQLIRHPEELQKVLNQNQGLFEGSFRRTTNWSENLSMYYDGTSMILRRIIGLDWSKEIVKKQDFEIVEGQLSAMGPGKVMVSDAAVRKSGARVGDRLTLEFTTPKGERSTLQVELCAVYRETSVFAYAAYTEIEDLNSALGYPVGTATEWAIIPAFGQDRFAVEQALRTALTLVSPTLSVARDNPSLAKLIEARSEETVFAVLGQSYYIGRLQDIIDSLDIVAWFLLTLLLLVVMVGINNTYRLIIRERTKEIGTMRAIGLQKQALGLIFLVESTVIGLIGAIIGIFLGLIILLFLGTIDFSWYADASLLLRHGHLDWALPPWRLIASILILLVAVITGAYLPARKAAKIRPVDTLRTES